MIPSSANLDQGIVSNDCFPDGTGLYADGNSLFISANYVNFNGGLKDLTGLPGTTVTVVSNIEQSQSTYLRVATQCLHHACNCTIMYTNKAQCHG